MVPIRRRRPAAAVVLLSLLLGAGAASRAAYGFEWDELQLLHGAWRIGAGDVPYRDFFEHHPPLLHALLAPLVRDRHDISPGLLLAARGIALAVLAMLVAGAAGLARRAAGRRAARWAALSLIVAFPFAGKLFELRADWCALAVLFAGLNLLLAATARRPVSAAGGREPAHGTATLHQPTALAVAAGLCGGTAACFTQKAVPLWAAAIAWSAVAGRHGRTRAARTVAAVAGTAVPLLLLAAVFWRAGALRALWHGVIEVNVDWPPEIDWRTWWYAAAPASAGLVALAGTNVVVEARRAWRRRCIAGARSLLAVLTVAGVTACLLSPVPWEQSVLFLVAPWVGLSAVATLASWARSRAALRRDLPAAAVLAGVTLATLPHPRAVQAALVWGVAGIAIGLRARALPACRPRVPVVLSIALLPPVLWYAADRWEDAQSGRAVAQLAFARGVAAAAQPDDVVLTLWDHVLPFRRPPGYFWFAHEGMLRRLARMPDGSDALTPLDRAYAEAAASGRATVVVGDVGLAGHYLPRLAEALRRYCTLLMPGYGGSDAFRCAKVPDA